MFFDFASFLPRAVMQGIPLLAIMDECDIVRDIQSGAGLWVRNGESERLAKAIRFLRDNPEKARDMRLSLIHISEPTRPY